MEILQKINWVDILVVIIMLRISYVAFQDGLTHEIFPLVGVIVTAVLSLHYYHTIALYSADNIIKLPISALDFLCFIVLIIAIGIVFKFLRVLLDKIIKVTWHPLVEKFGGLVIGLVRASVVTSVVLIILSLMPLSYMQRSIRDKSLTGMYFLRIMPTIYAKLSPILPTITIQETPAASEGMIKDLVADKSVFTQSGAKGAK